MTRAQHARKKPSTAGLTSLRDSPPAPGNNVCVVENADTCRRAGCKEEESPRVCGSEARTAVAAAASRAPRRADAAGRNGVGAASCAPLFTPVVLGERPCRLTRPEIVSVSQRVDGSSLPHGPPACQWRSPADRCGRVPVPALQPSGQTRRPRQTATTCGRYSAG